MTKPIWIEVRFKNYKLRICVRPSGELSYGDWEELEKIK